MGSDEAFNEALNRLLPRLRTGLVGALGRVIYLPRFYSDGVVAEEEDVANEHWPECQKCQTGSLLPLSDFGGQGAPIHYKAWVCSNPDCGFNIKIRNGDVYLNEPIASGAMHSPRVR